MEVIALLLICSLSVALIFLGGFIWAVSSGQYEDTEGPAIRILRESQLDLRTDPEGNRVSEQLNFK
jgi:cbb3-type cytochrome oxidase maturation protein